jgi:hypothetical protein
MTDPFKEFVNLLLGVRSRRLLAWLVLPELHEGFADGFTCVLITVAPILAKVEAIPTVAGRLRIRVECVEKNLHKTVKTDEEEACKLAD